MTDVSESKVAALVTRQLQRRIPGAATPAPQEDLRGAGLTSLDMVNLMLALEEAYDLTIPEDRLTPANFASIAAMEQLVESLAA